MDNFDFPGWIQAVSAIATFILASIVARQKTAIKGMTESITELTRHSIALEKQAAELTKHTAQMEIQTKTLVDSFELEKQSALKQAVPIYEKEGKLSCNAQALYKEFTLLNIGKPATNINPNWSDDVKTVDFLGVQSVSSNQDLPIRLYFDSLEKFNNSNFEIEIYSDGPLNQTVKQTIRQDSTDFGYYLSPLVVIK